MSERQKSTICVLADFGPGPYAWLRSPALSLPSVGNNIADAERGFHAKYNISENLQKEFGAWAMEFNRDCEREDFPWARWNEQGIALAQRLNSEVGNRFLIEYHFPWEDPGRRGEILVISSGNEEG
jgi:hypothetical protein